MATSITVRPRVYKEEYFKLMTAWLKKNGSEYIIALEKNNHLQIGVITTMRSNNIRRSLLSHLKFTPEDEAEKQYWLKISSHDDWKYLVGYCLKDDGKKDYELSEDIDSYINYYKDKKESIGNNQWICTSINNLPWKAYEFFKEEYPNYIIKGFGFKAVVIMMFKKGLIPFSLARKIRKEDEVFWKALIDPKFSIVDAMKWDYE